jgi:hypothetical protein
MNERSAKPAPSPWSVSHPNGVRIFDVLGQDDVLSIVMDLIRLRSLLTVVNDDGPMDPQGAVRIGLEVLAAVGAWCHRRAVPTRGSNPLRSAIVGDRCGRAALFDVAGLRVDLGEEPADGLYVLGRRRRFAIRACRGEPVSRVSSHDPGVVVLTRMSRPRGYLERFSIDVKSDHRSHFPMIARVTDQRQREDPSTTYGSGRAVHLCMPARGSA